MKRVQIVLAVLLLGLLAACGRDTAPEAGLETAAVGDLVITGVIDGPLSGGVPKAVELYAVTSVPDLSVYGLESANNGAGAGGPEFTFPAASASAGDFIYVATEATEFTKFFGFTPDYTSGAASINGDDAIVLYRNGNPIDEFGEVGVDGTGEPWEYLDGWAYRAKNSNTGSDDFVPGDWTYSGPDAFDGETTNATADTPFPIGTYRQDDAGGGTGDTVEVGINELRISSSGSGDDSSNYVELVAEPGTSLDGLSLLVVSSEFEPGRVDFAFDLAGTTVDDDGRILVRNADLTTVIPQAEPEANDVVASFDFFGSPSTFLVVDGFEGAQGDDLDTDNDGTPEGLTGAVIDGVSLVDGDSTADVNYADTVVGPSGNFPPAGVARDPDSTGGFVQLEFGDVSQDTPGTENFPEEPVQRAAIYEIQGAALTSPFVDVDFDNLPDDTSNVTGDDVTTTGVVTAVGSNGFYLQDPTGDGDDATSDGIFVFTGSAPRVSVGDELEVSGTVSEFFPGGTDTRNQPITQISGSSTVTTLSTGNALPAPVILGAAGRVPPDTDIDDDALGAYEPEGDGLDFFESVEGMLVTGQDLVAVAGTNRFGEIFTVANGGAGADTLSARGTNNIAPRDFNPEKIQIDPDSTVSGFDAPEVDTGARLGDVTGVVSYSFGNYEILPTEDFTAQVVPSALQPESSAIEGDKDTLTVASYNVLNLDPNDSDGDADVADGRFDAIADQIVNNLNAPDILALQEVQDNDGSVNSDVTAADLTLRTLIEAIASAGGPTYSFIDNTFIEDDQSGGEPGGNIRVAFLYNGARVELAEGSVRPVGDQAPGSPFNGARLPLVAEFRFNGEDVTVVNNHFSSKGGSAPIFGVEQPFEERQEDVTVNGSLDERRAQSDAVQNFVNGLEDEDVVVLGDFNEFEFVSPVTELETDAGLNNLTETLPEDERYSFIFQGNSQSLDHILVSDSLLDGAEFDIVHVNSEFAETDARASDHDPVLAGLELRLSDTSAPVITLKRPVQTLFPPNHKYQTINLAQVVESVSDNVDDLSVADVVITRVTSDEPENGVGDGNTTDDIVLEGCQTVKLRAERSGRGDGRVYTVELAVRDAAGNVGTASYQVEVPKGRKDGAVDSGAAYSVTGCGL